MSLEDVFLELTDDSGKAARKLKKCRERQLKQKNVKKNVNQKQTKRLSGKRLKQKSTDAAESAAETKQEEGDAQ